MQSLFNKVAGLSTCKFIKKRLRHRCFSVKLVKFLSYVTQTLQYFEKHLKTKQKDNVNETKATTKI